MINSIFDQPREKGMSEWSFDKYEAKSTLTPLVIVLIVIALVLAFAFTKASINEFEQYGIQERNGVLYYPDGNPVRNYQQLNLYMQNE